MNQAGPSRLSLRPDDRMRDDTGRNSLAARVSARATVELLRTPLARRLPMIGLVEFPKSGGTWVGQMLAAYFGVPFPQRPRFPVLMRCVWHGHWSPPRHADVLVVRDPRDCYVSLFHQRISMASSAQGIERRRAKWRQMYELFPESIASGRGTNADLQRYIEALLDDNRLGEPDWVAFHRTWARSSMPAVARYHELRSDPVKALSQLVERLVGDVDMLRVELAVRRFEFDLVRGEGDQFVRRGIASGGWQSEIGPHLWDATNALIPDDLAPILALDETD